MELVLLQRLIVELDDQLRGTRIDQVYALPRHHLVLVLGKRGAPRLWFSAEPDEPHLYLRRGPHATPERPPAFAMAVRKHARGRRIESLGLLGNDRVAELRWSGTGSRLILELVPRRATALVLDSDDRVVAVWNPRRGRPAVGSRYAPPPRSQRPEAGELTGTDWQRIAAPDDAAAVRRQLQRSVAGVSRSIADEIVARWQAGEAIDTAAHDELRRAASEATMAVIYSPSPLDGLVAAPSAGRLLLSPYALPHSQREACAEFDSLTEAAEIYYRCRARLRALDRARSAMGTAIRSRRARLQRARGRITPSGDPERGPERLRRHGDLLLAHPDSRIEDDHALVPDDYGDGSTIRIPVDPKLDLVGNAGRLYARAKRLQRKAVHDAQRLLELDRQLRQLEAALERVATMATLEQRDELAGQLRPLGAAIRPEALRAVEAALGQPAAPAGVAATGSAYGTGIRRLELPDGTEILVGRSATGNDRLTHRIAAASDWWLHAEGPGSHVVLRNPRRAKVPPTHALHAAATLAAWFSKARQATQVEVRWTRAADVRKPRKGAPGMALLESYKSLRVRPRSPRDVLSPRDVPSAADADET